MTKETNMTQNEFANSEGVGAMRARQNSENIRFGLTEFLWVERPLEIMEVDCRQAIDKNQPINQECSSQLESGKPLVYVMEADCLTERIFTIKKNLEEQLRKAQFRLEGMSKDADQWLIPRDLHSRNECLAEIGRLSTLICSDNQVVRSLASGSYDFPKEVLAYC